MTSNMGDFTKLPLELRLDIWHYVICSQSSKVMPAVKVRQNPDLDMDIDGSSDCSSDSDITTASNSDDFCASPIRYLCREITTELYSIFYGSTTMHFNIKPLQHGWDISGIEARDSKGRRAYLQHAYLATGDEEYPGLKYLRSIRHLPYQYFKSVEIEIEPTNPENPGELVETWIHLTWLLNLLSARPSAAIRLRFIDTPYKKWHQDGFFTRSFKDEQQPRLASSYKPSDMYPKLWMRSDIELLHLPIHASPLRIEISYSTSEISSLFAETPCMFGTIEMSTDEYRREQLEWTLYLDILLDLMKGPAAHRLRIERFATWTDEYFYTIWANATSQQHMEQRLISTESWKPAFGTPRSMIHDSRFLLVAAISKLNDNTMLHRTALYLLATRTFRAQKFNPWSPHNMLAKVDQARDSGHYPIRKHDRAYYDSDDDWRSQTSQASIEIEHDRRNLGLVHCDTLDLMCKLLREKRVGWSAEDWWADYGDGSDPSCPFRALRYPPSREIYQGLSKMRKKLWYYMKANKRSVNSHSNLWI